MADGLLFAFGLLFRLLKVWNLSEWCNVLQIKVEIKVAKSKSGREGKSWRFELTLRTGKFREREKCARVPRHHSIGGPLCSLESFFLFPHHYNTDLWPEKGRQVATLGPGLWAKVGPICCSVASGAKLRLVRAPLAH